MQEQYKHSSVFLTVPFYDSKESKKMAVFYKRHRGKQNKDKHKSKYLIN